MKKEQGVKKEWKKWIEAYEVEGMRREHRGMRRIRRRGEGERWRVGGRKVERRWETGEIGETWWR